MLSLMCLARDFLLVSQSASIAVNPQKHASLPRSMRQPHYKLLEPSTYQRPRFRWWWPEGWIEPSVITEEVQEIAATGFGGAEIADVVDSITTQLDPSIYGWGQERWNDGVLAAYEEAKKLGIYMDYTLGAEWPTGVPGYTPDSPETSKELVHGQVLVLAGQKISGSLPLPIAPPSGQLPSHENFTSTPQLLAILAANTNATTVNDTVIGFQPSTLVDLTPLYDLAGEKLEWTAPSDGDYVFVAVYYRGTGQIQNAYDYNPNITPLYPNGPGYVVDHLSKAGVEASIRYWDEHILGDSLRSLIKGCGGSLFEDSLELALTQYWTPTFLTEFQTRRGYDLKPYLLYILKDNTTFTSLGDSTTASEIQYDFYRTVTDLYISNRLSSLQTFTNSLGLKLRVQPYTATFDSSLAASYVDIPEGESLAFTPSMGGSPDSYRILATGRDIAQKTTILSNELGAYFMQAYGVTWRTLLGTANGGMSVGVSQNILHGFAYRDSVDSLWPGFSPFTPFAGTANGFAEAWGPREPQWRFANKVSNYLANTQALLQSGGPSVDIAILNMEWGVEARWSDTGLNDAGYTYQFPTPSLLHTYNATVSSSPPRLLPSGPSYKALVLPNISALNLNDAEQILEYANAGLPIIILGTSPKKPASYCPEPCVDAQKIKEIFEAIRGLGTTRSVDTEASVPGALEEVGVGPSVIYSLPTISSVTSLRRRTGEGYLYFMYSTSATEQTIQLEGSGYPLEVDLWTGEIRRVVEFTSSGGYVSLKLRLAEDAAAAIYLDPTNPYGVPKPEEWVTSISPEDGAEAAYDDKGRLVLRAMKKGGYEVDLSSGSTKTITFDSVPEPIIPRKWTLRVQDWTPDKPGINGTRGAGSAKTKKTWLDPIELHSLAPWPEIKALGNASGVGVYSATVNLDLTWERRIGEMGVRLDVGKVEGSFGVSVNGDEVEGVDLFNSLPIDITDYVRQGANDIEITVATTLWNRLISVWPEIYGNEERQDIGLVGPVTLRYYVGERIV